MKRIFGRREKGKEGMNDEIYLKSVYYQVSLTRSECRRRGGSKRKPCGAVEPGREEVGTD